MAARSGTGGAHLFGWVVLASFAYIAIVAGLMLQAPDTAEDYSVMGDNTFFIIGVLFIAALFIIAMQLAPEGGTAVERPATPAFSEASLPPPPKEFQAVAPPAPPAPPTPPLPPAHAEVLQVVPPPTSAEQIVVKYPAKVDGGLFGDTLVRVGPTTMLQVRSVLADEKDLF
ncbi:MAG: hypothetical protein L0Z54_01730 [Thermoplasmata archaeon]|nr:hypothetical protein [Thermoplasmata archaeon]